MSRPFPSAFGSRGSRDKSSKANAAKSWRFREDKPANESVPVKAPVVEPPAPILDGGLVVCFNDGANYNVLVGNESRYPTSDNPLESNLTIDGVEKRLNRNLPGDDSWNRIQLGVTRQVIQDAAGNWILSPEVVNTNEDIITHFSNIATAATEIKRQQAQNHVGAAPFPLRPLPAHDTYRCQFTQITNSNGYIYTTFNFHADINNIGFPKGQHKGAEIALRTAMREASEETGFNFNALEQDRFKTVRASPFGDYKFYILFVNEEERDAINACITQSNIIHFSELFSTRFITVGALLLNEISQSVLNYILQPGRGFVHYETPLPALRGIAPVNFVNTYGISLLHDAPEIPAAQQIRNALGGAGIGGGHRRKSKKSARCKIRRHTRK